MVGAGGNKSSTIHGNGMFGNNPHNRLDHPKKHRGGSRKLTPANVLHTKKRKLTASSWLDCSIDHHEALANDTSPSTSGKRDRSESDEEVFMSRDEIEQLSPSRKDGIDVLHESHLRYSYCTFIQHLGMQLGMPQTTIGTAMVFCHRFFVRHSHASHDRFLIATSALFLASKSEETPCRLNNILRTSCEIFHGLNFSLLMNLFPVGWFEQFEKWVLEAEQTILTTLDFELDVQHPYTPLAAILNKLGLSHPFLVNLALALVSQGLRSSLWLQFGPRHIAAGAAYLAARFSNLDLDSYYYDVWKELDTTPVFAQEVTRQLMELL